MSETKEQPTRAYHHGDLRKTLVQAGIDILSEGGAASLDLRKVARKAGVSHAAPYRHFQDKQALIAAINEYGFQQLAEKIRQALQNVPEDNTAAQLQRIAQAYISFAHENPWLMREMFSGMTIDRQAYPDLYNASKTVTRIYIDVIKRGQQRRTIIDGDAGMLAGTFWSMLHGIAMLTIENQMSPYTDEPESMDAFTRQCIQTLYTGLGHR